MEHHDLAENEVGDKECCQILIFVWRREKKLRLPEFFIGLRRETTERNTCDTLPVHLRTDTVKERGKCMAQYRMRIFTVMSF